jgi:phage terminase Nu1 subunit (DNA packaging protein)
MVADGAPVAQPGRRGYPARYDVTALRRWREAKVRGGKGVVSLEQARTRQALAHADRVELATRTRRGELLEVAEVEAVWREILATLRTRLLALPSEGAPPLAALSEPHAVEAWLRRSLTQALRELSQWRPRPRPGRAAGWAAEDQEG